VPINGFPCTEEEKDVADVAFVALTVACFGIVALIARVVDRL